LTEVPVTVYAADSSWTAEADAGPTAHRFGAEPFAGSEERSSPPDRETAAVVPGTQFPPVAEPVRMERSGTDDTSVWGARGDGDESSDHHVSVGERLRRWLSRSPEPDDADDELSTRAPEMVEPLPIPALSVEIPPTPTPLPQPEPEPFQPVSEAMAAAEPDVAPAVEPSAISGFPIPGAASPEMPTAQAGVSTVSMPLPHAAFPTPALVSPTPPEARANQPTARRRRPREIIVPLELSPDDLAEGVVLKLAIRVQEIAGDSEDEAEQYAA